MDYFYPAANRRSRGALWPIFAPASIISGPAAPQPSLSFDITSNHAAGLTYDAVGNVTSDGMHTYQYDAEGLVTAIDSSTQLLYDPTGHLVHSTGSSGNRFFAYGINARREAVLDGNDESVLSTQVYAGSQPIAFITGGQLTFQYQIRSERKVHV